MDNTIIFRDPSKNTGMNKIKVVIYSEDVDMESIYIYFLLQLSRWVYMNWSHLLF